MNQMMVNPELRNTEATLQAAQEFAQSDTASTLMSVGVTGGVLILVAVVAAIFFSN